MSSSQDSLSYRQRLVFPFTGSGIDLISWHREGGLICLPPPPPNLIGLTVQPLMNKYLPPPCAVPPGTLGCQGHSSEERREEGQDAQLAIPSA